MERKREPWSNPNYTLPTEAGIEDTKIALGKAALEVTLPRLLRRKGDQELTGIPAIDAAIRIHQRITDLEMKIEELKKNADIDAMTGCFSLSFWNKYKDDFQPAAERDKVALFYIDINGLKEINDTPDDLGGGHLAGDRLIIQTADFLRDNFRDGDLVIHPHGDEFQVICRDENGINNDELAQRLEIIRNKAKQQDPPLSFAAGFAVFDSQPHDGQPDTDLARTEVRAEQAMYANKAEMKMDGGEGEIVT